MEDTEKAKALEILKGFFWQPAEGHNYRFSHATCSRVLFHESAPMEADALQVVTEYLRQLEDVTEIVIAGKKHSYTKAWNTMDVWWQTAPGEKFQGTDSTKVRIYWALAQVQSEEADGPYTVENGCRYKVTHSFYWDVSEMPTVPASTSGVAYTLQGVTRDRQTGLFSCVLETRERVQQDIESYRQAETVFETVDHEQHLGVKADDIAKTGKEASAGSGVVVRRELSKNDDCTSNIENHTTTEVAVTGTVTQYRKTLRGTVTATTDRNQTAALVKDGIVLGETRRSEMTEGGRFNNTTEKVDVGDGAGKIATDCTQTKFEHQHAETDNTTTAETSDDAPEVAADGTITRKSVRKTEEGTYDVTTTTTKPKAVAGTVKEYRKTLRGSVEVTTDRNQSSAVNSTGMVVGETRRSEMTEGGLFNNTKQVPSTQGAGVIQRSCQKSTAEHTDVTVSNESTMPASVEVTASANVVVRKTARLTEEGTADVEEQTTTYSPQSAQATGGTSGTTVQVETHTNDEGQPESDQGGVNKVVSISASPNEHGSYNWSKQTTTYTARSVTSVSEMATLKTTAVTTINSTESTVAGHASSVSPNEHGSNTTTKVTYEPLEIDTGWITWESTEKMPSYTYRWAHGIRIFRNLETKPSVSSGKNISLDVTINQYGLYDGRMVYRELIAFTKAEASETGGSIAGSAVVDAYDPTTKTWKKKKIYTIAYWGHGNEGAEASVRANCCYVPGVHLPSRTYITNVEDSGTTTTESAS